MSFFTILLISAHHQQFFFLHAFSRFLVFRRFCFAPFVSCIQLHLFHFFSFGFTFSSRLLRESSPSHTTFEFFRMVLERPGERTARRKLLGLPLFFTRLLLHDPRLECVPPILRNFYENVFPARAGPWRPPPLLAPRTAAFISSQQLLFSNDVSLVGLPF